MQTITYNQVQELVANLPQTHLRLAYEFLRNLALKPPQTLSPQREFMLLSLNERQGLLSEQAAELVTHYTNTQEDRKTWTGEALRTIKPGE